MNNTGCSRRKFLNRLGWVISAGAIGGMGVASVRFMFPNILYEPPKQYKIGRPHDYIEGVNYLPEKRIFVLRRENVYRVVSAECTHLGCTAKWLAEKKIWECPCHGSVFDEQGHVLKGPAPKPLPWYELTLGVDQRLIVNQKKIVTFSDELILKV